MWGKRTISSLQLPGKLLILDKMPSSPGRSSPPPWQGRGNTEGEKGAFIEGAVASSNSGARPPYGMRICLSRQEIPIHCNNPEYLFFQRRFFF